MIPAPTTWMTPRMEMKMTGREKDEVSKIANANISYLEKALDGVLIRGLKESGKEILKRGLEEVISVGPVKHSPAYICGCPPHVFLTAAGHMPGCGYYAPPPIRPTEARRQEEKKRKRYCPSHPAFEVLEEFGYACSRCDSEVRAVPRRGEGACPHMRAATTPCVICDKKPKARKAEAKMAEAKMAEAKMAKDITVCGRPVSLNPLGSFKVDMSGCVHSYIGDPACADCAENRKTTSEKEARKNACRRGPYAKHEYKYGTGSCFNCGLRPGETEEIWEVKKAEFSEVGVGKKILSVSYKSDGVYHTEGIYIENWFDAKVINFVWACLNKGPFTVDMTTMEKMVALLGECAGRTVRRVEKTIKVGKDGPPQKVVDFRSFLGRS